MKKLINKIDKLPIAEASKEGYKWMIVNFDSIQVIASKAKKIGSFRKACMNEIGFAPALAFSCKSCYESKELFVERLIKVLK